jgi:hypothetical protein
MAAAAEAADEPLRRGGVGNPHACCRVSDIFIYDPIAADPEGIINQGQSNLTARAIQVREGETVNERALLDLFKAVIASNRAGGWRKIQSSRYPPANWRLGKI